jgi:acetyltransferase-like isoleucine patch superfamily enzyme
MAEIRVPRETVNDDSVRIVRWLAADGEPVRAAAPVVEIETSKSVLEVEAPEAGRLRIMRHAGDIVGIGELLGLVGEAARVAPPPPVTSAPPSMTVAGANSRISKKARELIAQHGLDESAFGHLPLVREADVLAVVAARGPSAAVVFAPAEAPQPSETTQPDTWRPRGLLGDAARSADERGRGVAWLVWNYFWRNWLLGNLVRVAPRGVINVLHRWRGVRMGRDCYIDPNAILETAYPENISLGDDVRVTAGAIVMTHIKAPHYLRDNGFVPVVLQPVRLDDHSFIGVNAVVLPGVTVGKAAVVASGAVVTADVPPFTMVSGNPAKVVKRFSCADDGARPGSASS